MHLMVSGSMEPAKTKNVSFVRACWRVEVDLNFAVNNIPETFSYMGVGVEVR